MRKFLLLIAVALFSIGTNAQEAIWDASIASVREGSDMPVNSIATIAEDGSLYVAGARDKKFDFANGSVGSLTGGAYVAKYDAEGKELFAVSLAGAMEITAITSDADKNLYVAGVFAEEAFIGEVSGEGQTINGGFGDKYVPYPSAFLAKYDANGNLLTVKSYQASEDATIVDSGLYWGDIVAVSISKIIAEGSKVYVQFNYSGDVTIDTNLSLVAKYVFAYGMAYIDASNIAVVSFDSVLENAVSVASLAVADGGIDVSNVHDFDFAVEDESVYVAAFAAGNVVLSTAESSEAFDFILDDSGNQEEGFIIANIGEDAVKFTNTPCEGLHSYYNTIAGMEVSDGCIYIAGTFNNVLALDNETTAVGASDVFVASVDAATLDVNFVSANANDEGATNQYYGEVSGAVYTAGSVLVYDQIVDMGSYNNSYKNYNVLLSDGTIEEAAEAQPATAVAYNSNYYALINCTDATNISVYSMPAPSTPVVLQTVEFNFTNNAWGIQEGLDPNSWAGTKTAGEYTDGKNTVFIDPTANGGYFYYENGYLRLQKPGTKIVLPAFDFAVEKIEVVGHASATGYSGVDMNVYVGGNAVSTACVGSTETYTYEIAAGNQADGNVYELVIGSNGGNFSSVMFITAIKVYPVASENALNVSAPVFDNNGGVFTEPVTVKISSPTAEIDGVEDVYYYYTINGMEPDAECEEIENGEITISSSCTLKVVLEFTFNGETYLSESTTAEYVISEAVTCEKATTVVSGEYFIVAGDNLALPYKNNVLPTKKTEVDGESVTDAEYCLYTITEYGLTQNNEKMFYIMDSNGNYISMNGHSATNSRISASTYPEYTEWIIVVEDGAAKIMSTDKVWVLACKNSDIVAINATEANATTVYPSLYAVSASDTAIEDVDAEVADNAVYDLTGRRVNEITKAGIYIVDGKKVLVK